MLVPYGKGKGFIITKGYYLTIGGLNIPSFLIVCYNNIKNTI